MTDQTYFFKCHFILTLYVNEFFALIEVLQTYIAQSLQPHHETAFNFYCFVTSFLLSCSDIVFTQLFCNNFTDLSVITQFKKSNL